MRKSNTTGRSEVDPESDVLWKDATLDRIAIDYDTVVFEVVESTGRRVQLTCRGYIGFQWLAVWDEMVIDRATFVRRHELLDSCIRDIHRRFPATIPRSGSPARNKNDFRVLEILLDDGATILVAAAEFSALAP